jgi:hypothetical protein
MATVGKPSDDRAEPRLHQSPLDPFVEQVLRWIAESPEGVPAVGLSAAVARELDWPPPFADAILASVKARRILRVQRGGTRSLRLGLSRRGEAWLEERSTLDQRED